MSDTRIETVSIRQDDSAGRFPFHPTRGRAAHARVERFSIMIQNIRQLMMQKTANKSGGEGVRLRRTCANSQASNHSFNPPEFPKNGQSVFTRTIKCQADMDGAKDGSM